MATLGFNLVSSVQFPLDPKIFLGGPWVHLATVTRRQREYCAFRHAKTGQAYVEIVNPQEPGLFQKITDDAEWADIYRFLTQCDVFRADRTIKLAT